MERKAKNASRALILFASLAMTISVVATLSINKKVDPYICETDRILDDFTAETEVNSYPNGTNDFPTYSTGLKYSTSESTGSGTIGDPYQASVSRGTCTDTAVELPEYYKKSNGTYYKLVGIDHDGFNAQKPAKDANNSELGSFDLTSITSLKDFKYVGSQAFAYTSISTVEFSSKLSEFSPSTFFHCKNLKTTNFVRLNDEGLSETGTYAAISSVGNNCFADCIKYQGMTLPETLTTIGDGAYQNCLSLTSIFLPATSVGNEELHVGSYAFAGCSKVTSVYFSSKVKSVGAHAFEGCINAKGYSALSYEALLARLGKSETGNGDWNYLFNSGTYDNEGTGDTFLDFTGRSGGGDVRYDAPYIYSPNADGTTCTLLLYDGSYIDDPNPEDIPEGVEIPMEEQVLWRKKRLIPRTRSSANYLVTVISDQLFKDNKDMEELIIPETVTDIGVAAFAGCTNLKKITLNEGLKNIGDFAFAPWNGTNGSIGEETKSNKLTSLEIPASVEEIGIYAFPYMYEMKNIEFVGSDPDDPVQSQLKHIGDYAFIKAGWDYKEHSYYLDKDGKEDFSKVRNPLVLNMHPTKDTGYEPATTGNAGRPNSLPDTYTEIGDYAFFGNQWIGSIRITSDHLVTKGFVFANCYWLVEADLGEGLVILGNGKNEGDKDGSSARDGRGRLFSVSVDEANPNVSVPANTYSYPTDLGGPLSNDSDPELKPIVPMSSLYIPELAGAQSTGQGTLDGRYHTMIFTKCPPAPYDPNSNSGGTKWIFQWKGYNGVTDLMPTYLDMGSVPTSSTPTANDGKFSNDRAYNNANYYGVDNAYGNTYVNGSDGQTFYQVKQAGYFGVTFAHASVSSSNGTYSAKYFDGSGNEITSLDSDNRYAFTTYDSATGRAKFDFIQMKDDPDGLILAKFHYNPYWEQSRSVTIPSTVTFGGKVFTVKEIGNCAFFRNICPQSHAWHGDESADDNNRIYISPQEDQHEDSTNESTYYPDYYYEASGEEEEGQEIETNKKYYADYNNKFYNLESVVLPNTIERIGGNAFYMCAGLQSITTAGREDALGNPIANIEGRFPDTLQKIGQYAFSFTGITSISLPNTITLLGNSHGLCNPFANCMALTSISVDAGGSKFISADNLLKSKDGKTIYVGPTGTTSTSIEIPSGTTTLGSLAYRGARSIQSITIPTSLEEIGVRCFDPIFYGETNLTNGNSNRGDKTYKGIYTRRKSALTTMSVKDGGNSKLKRIMDGAFYYCQLFNGINFVNQLENIGNYAFYRCEVANNYYIPNTLKTIGSEAFSMNKAFNTIKTPAKPSGETAKYLNLSATALTSIGANAFRQDGTENFDKLSLPGTLTSLNDGCVFHSGYKGLKTVYVHENLTSLNSGVFSNHSKLSTFKTWSGSPNNGDVQNESPANKLPDNLTAIGPNCFQGCTSLASFAELPSTLTSIGSKAFNSCTNAGFTTVDLSNSTENLSIGSEAFNGCTNITTLSLVDDTGTKRDKAGGNLTLGSKSFYGCAGLTEVILPRGSTVAEDAFDNCTNPNFIFYICDTYTDAANTMKPTMKPQSRPHLYYAEDYHDKVGSTSIRYWHYVNGQPTEWVPPDPEPEA